MNDGDRAPPPREPRPPLGGPVAAHAVRVLLAKDRVDGDEVVQIYVKDVVASHSTPAKELKAFKREHIPAGTTKIVELTVDKKDLELYQGDGVWKLEPGEFEFMAGGSSDELPLKETITL